jgi:hypothetical protein
MSKTTLKNDGTWKEFVDGTRKVAASDKQMLLWTICFIQGKMPQETDLSRVKTAANRTELAANLSQCYRDTAEWETRCTLGVKLDAGGQPLLFVITAAAEATEQEAAVEAEFAEYGSAVAAGDLTGDHLARNTELAEANKYKREALTKKIDTCNVEVHAFAMLLRNFCADVTDLQALMERLLDGYGDAFVPNQVC